MHGVLVREDRTAVRGKIWGRSHPKDTLCDFVGGIQCKRDTGFSFIERPFSSTVIYAALRGCLETASQGMDGRVQM